MDRHIQIKTFNELTTEELYEILKIRMEVFVVEQECPYQDIDGMDAGGMHVFYKESEKILAYLRIINKDIEAQTVQIGRVLTVERGIGLGAAILRAGIETAEKRLAAKEIYIEAQVYAKVFYEREGFKVCGDEFLEDGIPHVPMKLDLKKEAFL